MGSQSSKLVTESQQKKDHLVQLSGQSSQPDQSLCNVRKDQGKMVNTLFKWNFGGNTVFVTGTFTEWVHHEPLQKQGQEFSACVRLPPGVHQYKFIVDGEWRFSPEDCQTTDENGNINNIIDTSSYAMQNNFYVQESHQRPVPPIDHNRVKDVDSFDRFDFDRLHITARTQKNQQGTQPATITEDASHVKGQKQNMTGAHTAGNAATAAQKNPLELQNEKYGFSNQTQANATNMPEFNFKDKAPACPPHLREVYFLRQKEVQNLNHWKEKQPLEQGLTEEEIQKQKTIEQHEMLIQFFNSDRSLAPPQHVTTKHTGIKTVKNQTYNVYCITQRFKQKYSTFKFFTSQYVENTEKLFIA